MIKACNILIYLPYTKCSQENLYINIPTTCFRACHTNIFPRIRFCIITGIVTSAPLVRHNLGYREFHKTRGNVSINGAAGLFFLELFIPLCGEYLPVRFKMAIPPKWYQFLVGLFASIGSFNFGYDLGIIAQVVASDSFVSKFNPTDTEKYSAVVKGFNWCSSGYMLT